MTTDALGGRLDPDVVANLAHEWGLVGIPANELANAGENETLASAEALIHELAHAEYFRGIAAGPNMNEDIDARFNAFTCKHASDRAECAAIAIARIVFEELGWDIDHNKVLEIAYEDFRSTMTLAQAKWHVDRAHGQEVNARRAGAVIAMLWHVTNRGPVAPSTSPQERVSTPPPPDYVFKDADASWLVLERPTAMCEG